MDNKKLGPFGQKRFTEQELSMIKNTFKDNEPLLKLMRKVFWPDYDYNAPLGQNNKVNTWLGLDQIAHMNAQDREIAILSQIRLNGILEQGLVELWFLANQFEESPEDKNLRIQKDTVK